MLVHTMRALSLIRFFGVRLYFAEYLDFFGRNFFAFNRAQGRLRFRFWMRGDVFFLHWFTLHTTKYILQHLHALGDNRELAVAVVKLPFYGNAIFRLNHIFKLDIIFRKYYRL